MIWNVWSFRTRLRVTGTSDFARRFSTRELTLNLDAQWVLGGQHWLVEVTEVPVGFMTHPSRIEWTQRRIVLCTEDFQTSRHAGSIVAHEFGHAAGNTGVLNRGDEYRSTSPHHADTSSVMNVGQQLRARHFRTVVEQLNLMIPGTRFTISGVR